MSEIRKVVGNTDIYLLDQILKNRYCPDDIILDAGCGTGRNLHWFYRYKYNIHALDIDERNVFRSRINYPRIKDNIHHLGIEQIEEMNLSFDHIICNAVLHFAESSQQFLEWFDYLWNALSPNGTIFIRMTSDVGIKENISAIGKGRYSLQDGTDRFLLTNVELERLKSKYQFEFLEPIKSVVVDNVRSMMTLVIGKI